MKLVSSYCYLKCFHNIKGKEKCAHPKGQKRNLLYLATIKTQNTSFISKKLAPK